MELVFIRHGFSEWNAKNLFTGWRDVNLTERGVEEAKAAGKKLFEKGYEFDIAFTSVLTRAIKTCNIVLEESHQLWIPQVKNWRLNERHYGALQGLDKKETAEKYGDEQVHIWRRSYDISPPDLDPKDPNSAHNDRRYANIPSDVIPNAENLKLTLQKGDLGEPTPAVAIDNITLRDVNDAIRNHPVELIGQELRGYMTDMKRIAVAG
jgi:2,3-bisphosphoglycerate-dependent phosphoglycerate mutase